MDPEITGVELLMWAGGCWNKGVFQPLSHNVYYYHYLGTCIHYADTKMVNIFSICYTACVRKVQILPFFLLQQNYLQMTLEISQLFHLLENYGKAIFILIKIHTYNVF